MNLQINFKNLKRNMQKEGKRQERNVEVWCEWTEQ